MSSLRERSLGLRTVDELFMTGEERADEKREKVTDISLSEIDDFPDHPFRVVNDEAMSEMVESIKQQGVLVPAIARKKEDGRYELISGHRRKMACQLAGMETMPVIVRDLDRDAATLIMVDSNLQREVILPSEKAFSYKMRLEAMKRQAGRPQKNSTQVGQNFENRTSVQILGEQVGESRNQIQRYIRLALIEACKAMTSPDATHIGSYRGFNLELSFDTLSKIYVLYLVGDLRHRVELGTDVHGNITRIENAIEAFVQRKEACESQLATAKEQLEKAKTEVEKPFPQEEELASKQARLSELNAALNMDQRDETILDGEPEEPHAEQPTRNNNAR